MWCSIYRFMISHAADEGRKPSPMTLRHIDGCDSCRRFYEQCLMISTELKRDTDDRPMEQAGEYARRVAAAIPEKQLTHKRQLKFRPLAAAACIGLVFIGALIFFAVRPDRPVQRSSQTPVVQQISAGDILAVLNRPLADPLSGELKQITNEADSAVKFIIACVNVDIANTTPAEN
jgi:hypothetical protein